MMMMMLCSLDIPGNLTSKFFLNLMKKFVLFASNCTNFPTASFTSDTPSDTASYAAAAASFMASFLLFSFVFLVLLLRDFSFSIWNLLNTSSEFLLLLLLLTEYSLMPLVLMVVVVFTGVFKKYLFSLSLSLSLSLSFLSQYFSLSFHKQTKKKKGKNSSHF